MPKTAFSPGERAYFEGASSLGLPHCWSCGLVATETLFSSFKFETLYEVASLGGGTRKNEVEAEGGGF